MYSSTLCYGCIILAYVVSNEVCEFFMLVSQYLMTLPLLFFFLFSMFFSNLRMKYLISLGLHITGIKLFGSMGLVFIKFGKVWGILFNPILPYSDIPNYSGEAAWFSVPGQQTANHFPVFFSLPQFELFHDLCEMKCLLCC